MVWSNWRGALMVTAAWVGLAWSQTPPPAPVTHERIMTVHENGTSTRCRVISTWRTSEGTQAYQLQAIESGEMITIVEDGPAASLEESTLAGKVKALPMRIFHWGRDRLTPPGVPASPEPIVMGAPATDASSPCEPAGTEIATNPVVITPVAANPVAANPISDNPVAANPVATNPVVTQSSRANPVTTKPIGKDQIIWWEEKNGRRVSPMIVTEGKNPFVQQPTIHTMPTSAPEPSVANRDGATHVSGGVPTVVDRAEPSAHASPTIVTTGPSVQSDVAATPVVTTPVVTSPSAAYSASMGTTPPKSRPLVQAAPLAPVSTTPVAKVAVTTPNTTQQKAHAEQAAANVSTLPITISRPVAKSVPAMPAPAYAANQAQAPYVQPGQTLLPNMPQPLGNGLTRVVDPVSGAGPYPTTAAAANSNVSTPSPAAPKKSTLAERIHNLLHPKRESTVVTTPDGKHYALNDKAGPAGTVATGPASFSTAAGPTATASAAPPTATVTQQSVNHGATPVNSSVSVAPPVQTAPQPAAKADPKDWRTMWGRAADGKAQVPGQSLVDQATGKPNFSAGSAAAGAPTTGNMPPASKMDNQAADILLSPEKFDPAGARLIPRGINMRSFKGDPASLMPMTLPTTAVATAPSGPAQSTTPQSTRAELPPVPAAENLPPLGGLSNAPASGTGNTGVTYMPAPPVGVPDPYRTPPPPRLPEPPQPNTYANAFMPPPPLPGNSSAGAMTSNPLGGTNVQPNPTQVAQNIPGNALTPSATRPSELPNPYYYAPQNRVPPPPLPAPPVAQANFPPLYAGSQTPNPAAPQVRQPIQPAQYNAGAAPPAPNLAVERRPTPLTGAPSAELAQILKVLRESPYPAQREWASNTLGTYDWRAHPEIVQLLLQAAQQDPAATVRASCVYSLAHMNAASEPVISTLYMLRNDADSRVRQEVEQALVRLKN